MTMPAWGDILPLTTKDWRELPDTTTPYYVVAKEGTYLHRKVAFGRGLIRHHKAPSKLAPVGNYYGEFVFDETQRIPAPLVAQIVDFFRRIWYAHKTEAEVILTQHIDTGEYRVYVPFQSVSTGHVHSIYDPTTIDSKYLVVGTMHSHCNFSAFHSSTDEGDAKDMDGMHFTVGHIDREEPEVAAMVAVNGTLYHYKDPGILADFSQLDAAKAPTWWDRYVYLGPLNDAPRPKWATDDMWDKFLGKKKTPPKPTWAPTPLPQYARPSEDGIDYGFGWRGDLAEYGYIHDKRTGSFRYVGSQPLRESREFNRKKPYEADWGANGELLWDEDYWEDQLGEKFVSSILNTGLFTDEDFDNALAKFPKSGTPQYWEGVFRQKLFRAVAWLRHQGLEVTVDINDKRITVVEGQTSLDQVIEGVL